MKLYFSPGTSSLACHIILKELNLDCELISVDLRTKETSAKEDYFTINPKFSIPYLIMKNGEGLSECQVILKYLADLFPESKLSYPMGSNNRLRLDEVLNYIAMEIHMNYRPLTYLNNASSNDESISEVRAFVKGILTKKIKYLDNLLDGNSFLSGENFTIADAYFYTTLTWAKLSRISFESFKNINEYFLRIKVRDSLKQAIESEKSIIKK